MMSISQQLQELIASASVAQFNEHDIQLYEAANQSFENLVRKGIISKRGCRLLTIENENVNNIAFNCYPD